VPDRVIDDLEAIEVDHERRYVAAVAAPTPQCLFQAVPDHRAVRQPGQRISEGSLSADLFFGVTLDRSRQDVGDSRQEVHVVRAEGPLTAAVDAEHPEGSLATLDRDTHAADDAVVEQHLWLSEPRFGAEVLDNDGF
jgi:hypothetical protein